MNILKFVPKGSIDNRWTVVRAMAGLVPLRRTVVYFLSTIIGSDNSLSSGWRQAII